MLVAAGIGWEQGCLCSLLVPSAHCLGWQSKAGAVCSSWHELALGFLSFLCPLPSLVCSNSVLRGIPVSPPGLQL